MTATLEQRIQVLEDIEAIRKLKARYCAGCDDDHNPDVLVALFNDDAVWEATSNGRYEGVATSASSSPTCAPAGVFAIPPTMPSIRSSKSRVTTRPGTGG